MLNYFFISFFASSPVYTWNFSIKFSTKDPVRAKLLSERMAQAGATHVICENHDFLTLDVCDQRYQTVRSILCDPSCSGSGVLRHVDRVVERKDQAADLSRIQKLSLFQLEILKKASSFPSVEVIVYSTCSIHVQENEEVVSQFLKAHSSWDLVAPQRFADWKRRGLDHDCLTPSQSSCLIRCDGKADGMNGFFVALFVKHGRDAAVSSGQALLGTSSAAQSSSMCLPVAGRKFVFWAPVSSTKCGFFSSLQPPCKKARLYTLELEKGRK